MSEDHADPAAWEQATAPLQDLPGVGRSTMMGLPCLRVAGAFFASWDRRTGDLLVKLPADRVAEMIESGLAHPFAPAGRRFREWAAIDMDDADSWPDLLAAAHEYVSKEAPQAGSSTAD